MAPRGRSRKKDTRMDAAIDAMKPLGFTSNLVVKTVKELLKVYGEEGWPFIEDSAYKVLIETILEKVHGEEPNDSVKPAGETSSETALKSACSSVGPSNTALQTSKELDCPSEANEALCTTKLTSGVTLEPVCSSVKPSNMTLRTRKHLDRPSEANGTAKLTSGGAPEPVYSSVNPSKTALQTSKGLDCPSEANAAFCTAKPTKESVEAEGSSRRPVEQSGSTCHTTPSSSHNPPMPGSSSTRTRRPYHGWICSDDDHDEEDLVELTPGPMVQEMEKLHLSFRVRKKRWDVKADDM